MRYGIMAFLAMVAIAGFARTGYLRGWYGRYNDGVPDLDGWGGLKLGIWAAALFALALCWPLLQLGVDHQPK